MRRCTQGVDCMRSGYLSMISKTQLKLVVLARGVDQSDSMKTMKKMNYYERDNSLFAEDRQMQE